MATEALEMHQSLGQLVHSKSCGHGIIRYEHPQDNCQVKHNNFRLRIQLFL